jgi:hypothetical protein
MEIKNFLAVLDVLGIDIAIFLGSTPGNRLDLFHTTTITMLPWATYGIVAKSHTLVKGDL